MPESSEMIASSGSTARQSATMRSGRIGEACASKFGRTYFSHSVRRVSAVAADEAERQRIAHVEAAHAVRRADHRHLVLARELAQLLARLGKRHAVADEEHRPA